MAELSKKIMRRVYYAFFLRQVTHPVFLHAALLLISLFALSRVVSVPDVLANLMQVKVGEVLQFFLGALLNTGTLTIVWLAIIIVTVASLIWRLFRDRRFVHIANRAEWV